MAEEPRWFRRWVGKHKVAAERELRSRCEHDSTVWVDRQWLDELGRDRVQEIVAEYGSCANCGEPLVPDRCTCLPDPDGVNDACPIHGEEAPCGHCGHARGDHEQPLTLSDHEHCNLCPCLDWFAVGEVPVR